MFSFMTLRTYVFLKFVFIIRNTTSLKQQKQDLHQNLDLYFYYSSELVPEWTWLWRNNHNRENYYNAVRLEYIAGSVPESSVPTNMFDWMLLSVIQTSFSGSNTPVPVFVFSWQMFSVFWLTYRCSNSSKLFPATFPCSTRSTKLRSTMKMLFLLHTTKVSAKKLSIFTTASADRCLQPYPAMTT